MLIFALLIKTKCAGTVAQSVEQRTENPRVGGSIPSRPTTFFVIPEPKGSHSPQNTRLSPINTLYFNKNQGNSFPSGNFASYNPLAMFQPVYMDKICISDIIFTLNFPSILPEWISYEIGKNFHRQTDRIYL